MTSGDPTVVLADDVFVGAGAVGSAALLQASAHLLPGGISAQTGLNLSRGGDMMIPLVVGIGIDDGVHILHRYLEEGKGSIQSIVQNTGKAIFLTTATTCLAFSTFLFAAHPGLKTLGPVSVIGIALCFVASIFLLPAIRTLMASREK